MLVYSGTISLLGAGLTPNKPRFFILQFKGTIATVINRLLLSSMFSPATFNCISNILLSHWSHTSKDYSYTWVNICTMRYIHALSHIERCWYTKCITALCGIRAYLLYTPIEQSSLCRIYNLYGQIQDYIATVTFIDVEVLTEVHKVKEHICMQFMINSFYQW